MTTKKITVKQKTDQVIDEYADLLTKKKSIENDLAGCKAELEELVESYYPDEKEFKSVSGIILKLKKSLTVVYDPDLIEKLLKSISKDLAEETVNKKIIIDDYVGLINYLSECGVDPKIFKSFLSVEKTVKSADINKLHEKGIIELESLKPCIISAKLSKSFGVK